MNQNNQNKLHFSMHNSTAWVPAIPGTRSAHTVRNVFSKEGRVWKGHYCLPVPVKIEDMANEQGRYFKDVRYERTHPVSMWTAEKMFGDVPNLKEEAEELEDVHQVEQQHPTIHNEERMVPAEQASIQRSIMRSSPPPQSIQNNVDGGYFPAVQNDAPQITEDQAEQKPDPLLVLSPATDQPSQPSSRSLVTAPLPNETGTGERKPESSVPVFPNLASPYSMDETDNSGRVPITNRFGRPLIINGEQFFAPGPPPKKTRATIYAPSPIIEQDDDIIFDREVIFNRPKVLTQQFRLFKKELFPEIGKVETDEPAHAETRWSTPVEQVSFGAEETAENQVVPLRHQNRALTPSEFAKNWSSLTGSSLNLNETGQTSNQRELVRPAVQQMEPPTPYQVRAHEATSAVSVSEQVRENSAQGQLRPNACSEAVSFEQRMGPGSSRCGEEVLPRELQTPSNTIPARRLNLATELNFATKDTPQNSQAATPAREAAVAATQGPSCSRLEVSTGHRTSKQPMFDCPMTSGSSANDLVPNKRKRPLPPPVAGPKKIRAKDSLQGLRKNHKEKNKSAFPDYNSKM